MLKDLILKNRSYRRFHEDRPVSQDILRQLVELGTLSPSAANLQPLKYALSWELQRNARIYDTLAWAGYLTDWPGPAPGERPVAYIVILGDKNVAERFGCDHGIAAQSILLGAAELGLGGCMIGSIQRPALREILDLPESCEILLVLALGYPKERVVIDPVSPAGDIRYWREPDGTHHVPKRPVDTVILP